MYCLNYQENTFLYSLVEMSRANMTLYRSLLVSAQEVFDNKSNPLNNHLSSKSISAFLELAERISRDYPKPEYNIRDVIIENKSFKIEQKIVQNKVFCDLINFKKDYNKNQPKILIVAPLSGHYSTLCKGTVRDLLPYFDVYITDWKNPRDIPYSKGEFDLDDYIDYCLEFFEILGEDLSVMAVCQPAVPVMAAAAIASEDKENFVPKNLILVGGPIDTTISPTEVNQFAQTRPINWFENNVITRVPYNYSGFMRPVYPGFIQLSGFMAMNMKRHIGEHVNLFKHLVLGDGESSEAHKQFYDEYLAVMDLPASYYLQTIKTVFKDHALAKNKMVSRERKINLHSITKSSLLVIEGEYDDITGLGQTKAAINLCKNIPSNRKKYHLQQGVGHYGLFNGSKFRNLIIPEILKFIQQN